MTSKEIRESFKLFFESHGHHIVPSAPMVIKDDPTLMFTNAGMNQFKDIILGNCEPKFQRATDSQKCLRVSGKHNDLEEVGHDTYHHTMFEMLGNWSFGDYFKKDAVNWAWEYLVDFLKINPANLYATVFEGSSAEGLDRDDEAASYWEKFLPADHIINGNKHDNFWEMGETGPCGPCSEIHIDLRSDEEKAKVNGAELVNKDNPHVIEIWNLVFMQFNRKADKTLEPLPAHVIDTGMGFERLCAVIQGKSSNYDTDIFQPLIKAVGELSNSKYGQDEKKDIAMRVISDHIRAIAFSIADGQLPGNVKAGYVIRRILRRAVRYGYTFLNLHEPFLYKLLPTLIDNMGEAYPELIAQKKLISKVTKEEEDAFLRTLATGMNLLDNVIAEAKVKGEKQIDGKQAFTLFDTFGFPLDLTELICNEQNLSVKIEEFNAEMQKQKERARNAATVETGDWKFLNAGEEQFCGWDKMETKCHILRYRKIEQKKKTFYEIVLDKTPFYGEMGGQVGDTGILTNENETIKILDTKRENNLSVHISADLPQHPEAEFIAKIDEERRHASEANHTATHLLDEALREVLGTHVEQRGSLVTPEYLRFDFSHFQKVTSEELRKVEQIVNEYIRTDFPLEEHREIPIEEAKKLGAIALFGEKYGSKVRTIRFGKSLELCGGCHAQSTGHLGFFRIISESSVAAGIRRIEAVTGKTAEETVYVQEDILNELKELFNNSKDLTAAIKKVLEEDNQIKKQLEVFMKEKVQMMKDHLLNQAKEKDGIKVISANLVIPNDIAKDLAFKLINDIKGSAFCVLGSVDNNKPTLTVMMSKDLVVNRRLDAGDLVREAAKLIQGGGGGAPHFATAGGKNADGLNAAIEKILQLAKL